MKVLAIGLSRCATSSLQAALESPTLDCKPCMHMARIAPYAERIRLVLAAMAEKDRVVCFPFQTDRLVHRMMVTIDGMMAEHFGREFRVLKAVLLVRGLVAWLAIGAGVLMASKHGARVFGGLGTFISGY
ncbi:hypothetical protein ESCO_005603 [Escovopsis weberi]|uniref:Uncharacterized protein n=1 Tax=Escovopsis weberi TaxID=150374 RepID=A0A0M9VUJ9_ESCWE|nr:hypothetical protein ESCO_005603 [Escovopsis weberi]